jgi:EAL domain-containing protein (putative c-di-GMP-specific phosphodiesterase class I)
VTRAGVKSDPSGAVLRALRELARGRGQAIVAEGVEMSAHLEVVRSFGFDAAHGYLLRHPGPTLDAASMDLDELAGRPDAVQEPATSRPGRPGGGGRRQPRSR